MRLNLMKLMQCKIFNDVKSMLIRGQITCTPTHKHIEWIASHGHWFVRAYNLFIYLFMSDRMDQSSL